jgi:hypothetical protein
MAHGSARSVRLVGSCVGELSQKRETVATVTDRYASDSEMPVDFVLHLTQLYFRLLACNFKV